MSQDVQLNEINDKMLNVNMTKQLPVNSLIPPKLKNGISKISEVTNWHSDLTEMHPFNYSIPTGPARNLLHIQSITNVT